MKKGNNAKQRQPTTLMTQRQASTKSCGQTVLSKSRLNNLKPLAPTTARPTTRKRGDTERNSRQHIGRRRRNARESSRRSEKEESCEAQSRWDLRSGLAANSCLPPASPGPAERSLQKGLADARLVLCWWLLGLQTVRARSIGDNRTISAPMRAGGPARLRHSNAEPLAWETPAFLQCLARRRVSLHIPSRELAAD